MCVYTATVYYNRKQLQVLHRLQTYIRNTLYIVRVLYCVYILGFNVSRVYHPHAYYTHYVYMPTGLHITTCFPVRAFIQLINVLPERYITVRNVIVRCIVAYLLSEKQY